MSALNGLTYLNLGYNYLTGTIPSQLSALNRLTYLNLTTSYLSGPIPSSFSTLRNLNALLLSGTFLTGTIPSILMDLGLSSTIDTTTTPASIIAQGNVLCMMFGLGLGGLTERWLSCDDRYNSGTGYGAAQYKKSPARWHTLGAVPIAVDGATFFQPPWCVKKWTGITCDIDNYNVIGIDLSMANIETKLSNGLPTNIGDLTALTSLNLNGQKVFGNIPSGLATISSLSSLDLRGNRFVGQIPMFTSTTSALTKLDLHGNSLQGIIPPYLGLSTALKCLDLGGNSLVGFIPGSMAYLIGLTRLDLSSNKLNGEVPTWIGSLVALSVLRLNDNRLTGSFPAALFTLADPLNVLGADFTLQNNFLTGDVPSEIIGDTGTTYMQQYDAVTTLTDNSMPGLTVVASQVFTGVTVAYANSNKFNEAYTIALSGIIGVPKTQIAVGKATAISIVTRRALEEVDLSIAEDAAARAVEEATAKGEESAHRELLAFNPNPSPSTTVAKPFTVVVFSTQGTEQSVTDGLTAEVAVKAITTLVSISTGLTTLLAQRPTIISTTAADLKPTLEPSAMPTYAAVPAGPTSRTIAPRPFTAPADKAKRCAQCTGQNYCPVPLGCF